MKNVNIVLCSILKPVNDVRMYGKLAQSISQLQGYNIHLIGQNIFTKNLTTNFTYHPITLKNRHFFYKFLAYCIILFKTIKLKPKLFICTSHELLSIGVISKFIFKTKLIYDVQENYSLNFYCYYKKSNYKILWIKLLSYLIRKHEHFFAQRYDHFFLAEKCYLTQLRFIQSNCYTILENKALVFQKEKKTPDSATIKILIFGTISEEYGIFDALHWVNAWHTFNPMVQLAIMGHVTRSKTFLKLKQLVANSEWIFVNISPKPIPYSEIIKAISNTNIGLLCYKNLPMFENKMPSKIFELAAMQKMIICSINHTWSKFVVEKNIGICVDFSNFNEFDKIELAYKKFWDFSVPISEFIWNSYETEKIRYIADKLLNQK